MCYLLSFAVPSPLTFKCMKLIIRFTQLFELVNYLIITVADVVNMLKNDFNVRIIKIQCHERQTNSTKRIYKAWGKSQIQSGQLTN